MPPIFVVSFFFGSEYLFDINKILQKKLNQSFHITLKAAMSEYISKVSNKQRKMKFVSVFLVLFIFFLVVLGKY